MSTYKNLKKSTVVIFRPFFFRKNFTINIFQENFILYFHNLIGYFTQIHPSVCSVPFLEIRGSESQLVVL